jgi:hypothetical protein
MRRARKHWEIVWTLRGEEQVFGPYASAIGAHRAFESGRPRVEQRIHGGQLRIDEVTTS